MNPDERILEAIAAIGDREWEEIRPHLHAVSYARGAYLQCATVPSERIFLLTHGLVREYYALEDGSERIRSFSRAGNFTAAYSDFIAARDSQVAIQALDEVRAIALPFRSLLELRRVNPIWERINHRLLEEMYVQKEKRELQFLTLSAGERYRRLHEDFPGIEQVVSQYHIASYLGITPVALSRIRGRLRSR